MVGTKLRSASSREINLKDYIILDGKTHGSYSYQDLLVAKHRLAVSEEVKRAAKSLGLNVENTALEKTDHPYIGNIQWEQALKLNLASIPGNFTLNPRQFFDFCLLFDKGIEQKGKKVYNGCGKIVAIGELKGIRDEIYGKRDPWRGEFLDAYFQLIRGTLFYFSDHRLVNGNLQPQRIEPLEAYLMEDCYVDIKSMNRQGFPTKKLKKEIIYYWPPAADRVAGFDAGSSRVDLSCDGYPQCSLATLGVRVARVK